MRFGPPPSLHSSLLLTGAGPGNGGGGFVGPLDGYTAGLLHLPCMTQRLLSSYTGPAFRMRVDTVGSPEYDVGFLADGTIDLAAINDYSAGDNWFVRIIYDQSGNGRHLQQSSAANQPRGDVLDGRAYCYAPGAGFSTTSLASTAGLGLAITDSTAWSIARAAGYALDLAGVRSASATERRTINYSNAIQANNPGAGTTATIASTGTGLYTTTVRLNGSGTVLSNRLTSATGTQASAAFTIDSFSFGRGGGGPSWAQDSQFIASGFWSTDLGATATAELNALAQILFATL